MHKRVTSKEINDFILGLNDLSAQTGIYISSDSFSFRRVPEASGGYFVSLKDPLLTWLFFVKGSGYNPNTGFILRKFRESFGLLQEELAEKAGLCQANISKMERGIMPITRSAAKKLSRVFGVGHRVFLS